MRLGFLASPPRRWRTSSASCVRLFRGETIVGHDGPMGRFPLLRLGQDYDVDIPMGLVAFAPNSLELAGRVMDQVILHTFFTDETLARCVKTVKSSAERAGRNPDDVKVWSCLATIGDHIPEEMRLRKLVGRLATYLQGYGDLMVRTNRWDPQVLQRFREDAVVKSFSEGGLQVIDSPTTPIDKLEHIATLLPPEWTAPAATGQRAILCRHRPRAARTRCRWRDPSRRHPHRVGADSGGLLGIWLAHRHSERSASKLSLALICSATRRAIAPNMASPRAVDLHAHRDRNGQHQAEERMRPVLPPALLRE